MDSSDQKNAFYVNNSRLKAYSTCERQFFFGIVLKKRSKYEKAFAFGLAFHKSLEVYDTASFAGNPHETCVENAVEACLQNFGAKIDETRDSSRNLISLIDSVVLYLDVIAKNDPWQTYVVRKEIGPVPAIELRLESFYETMHGVDVFLFGTLDRLCIEKRGTNKFAIGDYKTTGQSAEFAFSMNANSTQFAQYGFLVEANFGHFPKNLVLDVVSLDGVANIARKVISMDRDAAFEKIAANRNVISSLVRDRQAMEGNTSVEGFLRQGLARFRRNFHACSHFGGCSFIALCDQTNDKALADLMVEFGHDWSVSDAAPIILSEKEYFNENGNT